MLLRINICRRSVHVAGGVSYWAWERHPYPLPPSTRTPVTTLELVFIEDDALPPETILPSNLAKHVDEEPLKNRPLASPSPGVGW